jgi:G:T-mismatch repair DNA endonuclease (very short patch repair protein)
MERPFARFDSNPAPDVPDIMLSGKRGIFAHGCWFHADDYPRAEAPSLE